MATTLGLAQTKSAWRTLAFEGAVDGVNLSIRMRGSGVQIEATDAIPTTLRIAERPEFLSFQRALIDTGDEAFDNAIMVEGGAPEVGAMLTQETRDRVFELVSSGGTVAAGRVGKGFRASAVGRNEIRSQVDLVLSVARGLSLHEEPWGRLLANSKSDPNPPVRLRNLTLLVKEDPTSELTQEALALALQDPDPQVRLFAARFTADAAWPVLCALTGAEFELRLRCEAIRLLGRHVGEPEPRELLVELVQRPSSEIGLTAVRALRTSLVDAQSAAGPVAAALVETLAGHGRAEAEADRLRLLASKAPDTIIAAANVLGAQGSIASVEPLMTLSTGRAMDGDVKRAARRAINGIQARTEGAERGGLAVVEADHSGGLALAADEGALSHAVPERATADPGLAEREAALAESETTDD